MARALDPNWDSSKETTMQILPFYHQLGYMMFMNAVMYGTPIVILSRFDPLRFLQTIQRYKVSN